MKRMTREEMEYVVRRCKWATICTVTREMKPYAIEATPFLDGEDICFMINPAGGTRKNLETSDNVLVKFTITENGLESWAGVSCFGKGEFVSDRDAIRNGWKLLERVTGHDYGKAASKFAGGNIPGPLFRVKVSEMTGIRNRNYLIA